MTDNEPTKGIFDRQRSYDGQPHTAIGERGAYSITVGRDGIPDNSLTIRDIYDAVLIGICQAVGVDPEQLSDISRMYEHVDPKLADMDSVAAAQNATCEVEKRLGIYPNVSKTRSREDVYTNTEADAGKFEEYREEF